jgi:tripartite-type tricarboxylate transporter receptor subunit TctC
MRPLARRTLLGATALSPMGHRARAQEWPTRPLRLIVPFPPGGHIDSFARQLARPMATRLGQPVIVENRAGAGGSIGAAEVAYARPDGLTLLMGSNGSLVGNVLTQANPGFDPFRQLAPIGLCLTLPLTLAVRADDPARNIQDLLARSRATPGSVTCGSAGIGTSNHLALVLFESATATGIAHVPYRGTGTMLPDLLAGTLTCVMDQLGTAMALAREGKARLLVQTGAKRSSIAPNVPCVAEMGWGEAVFLTWNGLAVPTGTPVAIQTRLASVLAECLGDPDLAQRMSAAGAEVVAPGLMTPNGFGDFLRADLDRTRRAVQLAGLKPE